MEIYIYGGEDLVPCAITKSVLSLADTHIMQIDIIQLLIFPLTNTPIDSLRPISGCRDQYADRPTMTLTSDRFSLNGCRHSTYLRDLQAMQGMQFTHDTTDIEMNCQKSLQYLLAREESVVISLQTVAAENLVLNQSQTMANDVTIKVTRIKRSPKRLISRQTHHITRCLEGKYLYSS